MILEITSDTTLLGDIMDKSLTVAILLGVLYFLYKYHSAQQDKKDALLKEKELVFLSTIKEKDNRIDEQQKAMMELYGKAIEAQSKGNMIQEQLLDVLQRTREDVTRLSSKIR